METKEEEGVNEFLVDLQDWQKEILSMEKYDDILNDMFKDDGSITQGVQIPITKSQAHMLEKVLGDDFYIQDEKVREILEAVLELGFYYEWDRAILNLARDCYLKGRNWIKRRNGEV